MGAWPGVRPKRRHRKDVPSSPAPWTHPPNATVWNAGARGEPASANPHRPGTPEAAAWAAGRARWTAFVAENRRVWEGGAR